MSMPVTSWEKIIRIILLCGNNYTNSKDIVKVKPAYFDSGVSDLVRIKVLIITLLKVLT